MKEPAERPNLNNIAVTFVMKWNAECTTCNIIHMHLLILLEILIATLQNLQKGVFIKHV